MRNIAKLIEAIGQTLSQGVEAYYQQQLRERQSARVKGCTPCEAARRIQRAKEALRGTRS